MKKKIALIMAALLCSAAVATTLVGCGNENNTTSTAASETTSTASQAAATTVTLEQVRKSMNLNDLMADHDSLTAKATVKDEKGNVGAETTVTLKKDAATKQLSLQIVSKDSKGEVVYETEAVARQNEANAIYSVLNEVGDAKTTKIMDIVPEGDFQKAVLESFPLITDSTEMNAGEKEVECVEQDGDLVLSTTNDSTKKETGLVYDSYYYVNPTTLVVDAIDVDSKDEKGNLVNCMEVTFTYDGNETLDTTARDTIVGDKDAKTTKLTVNLLDMGEESGSQEIQEFTVTKDTQISIYAPEGKKAVIYQTPSFTGKEKPTETVDLTDDEVTIFVEFVNE